jgi:hypothetical protein
MKPSPLSAARIIEFLTLQNLFCINCLIPVFVLYVVTIGRVPMTATDAALIAPGERFEKLLRVDDAR